MTKRSLSALFLIAYGILLIKIMVLKDMPLVRIGSLRLNFGGTQEGPPNLIPFKTIGPYLLGDKGWIIAGINLFGNILLLVPIGFFIAFVFRGFTWKKAVVLAVAAGSIIEGMQVLLHVGIFDIDDVILNGLGVLVGYGAFVFYVSKARFMKPALIISGILLFISLAGFTGVYAYRNHRLPISFEPAEQNGLPDPSGMRKGREGPCCDLCNGTGGTGQIIGVGQHTITIKRRDGVVQQIKLTDKTMIKTTLGAASESDLKIGNKVTLVIPDSDDGSLTASIVLVCMEPKPEKVK